MSVVSTIHAVASEATEGVDLLPAGVLDRVREYRLRRVQQQLRLQHVPAIIMYDPVNIRYATDTSNMQVWTGRNPTRYVVVFADGPVVAFEFHNCEHVWNDVTIKAEIRGSTCWNYFNAGPEAASKARQWAREIADLLREHAPSEKRIAVDRLDPEGTYALHEEGIELIDGQALMEQARRIKSADELTVMKASIAAAMSSSMTSKSRASPSLSPMPR